MILIILFYLLTSGAWSVKDVSLKVPEAVMAGESLTLGCHFRLEHEHLYSVKFYRGDTEFYRFVPGQSPPTRVFPLQGVTIDVYRSNSSAVTLAEVHRELTGLYKCEVSGDAPLFHTAIKTSFVTVVEEPWALPTLVAEKTRYSLGQRILANCSSLGGVPLANLTWYANGKKVSESATTSIVHGVLCGSPPDDLDSSLSTLQMEAVEGMFQDGRLRLRCVATQYTLYRRSTELNIYENTPQLAPVLGPSGLQTIESCSSEAGFASRITIIGVLAFTNIVRR